MRWLTGVIVMVLVGWIVSITPLVFAESPLLIVAIQTGSQASASEEIIELFNASSTSRDITGMRLEYLSAEPKSVDVPSRTILLAGSVPPQSSLLLTSTGYRTSDSTTHFAPTLANSGGHLRLRSNDTKTMFDLVGWGSAKHALGASAAAPQPGEILRRIKNEQGEYAQTENNEADFSTQSMSPNAMDQGSPTTLHIALSEVLPNPGAPQTDAQDEFIELYNPNDIEVDVSGYTIKAGSNLAYSYKIPTLVLKPHEYKALFSCQTHIALSNTGGKVALLDPAGTSIDEAAPYTSASENTTWAWDNTTWVWSTQGTPNEANIFAAPDKTPDKVVSPANKSASKTTKTTLKKSTSKPAKTAETAKKKAAPKIAKQSEQKASPTIHSGILAGVGGSAVLYGAYEYRRDAANAIQKFRTYRNNRRKNR